MKRAMLRTLAYGIVWMYWVRKREEGKHTLAFGTGYQERSVGQVCPLPTFQHLLLPSGQD